MYCKSEVENLIELLETECIPNVEEITQELTEILENSEKHNKNCLIAKTTGVGAGIIGTGVYVGAVLLAGPFSVLPAAGLVLSALGTGTGLGTSATEKWVLQKEDRKKLDAKFEKFVPVKEKWEDLLEKYKDLKSEINIDCSDTASLIKSLDNEKSSETKLQWLKNYIFSDEIISIEDIKPGDHIYRSVNRKWYMGKIFPVYHHGVYLDSDQIADFGADVDAAPASANSSSYYSASSSSGSNSSSSPHPPQISTEEQKEKIETPVIRPLSDFLKDGSTSQVYRRNYKGFEVPVSLTITRAKNIVRGQPPWDPYCLLENNCEHFATFLKMEYFWSGQASSFQASKDNVIQTASKIPKVVQVGADVVTFCKKIPPLPPPSLFSKLKVAVRLAPKPTVAVKMVSKAAIAMGPITTAIDIGFLINDWKTTPPNIEAIQKAIEMMDRQLDYYKDYLARFEDIRRLL